MTGSTPLSVDADAIAFRPLRRADLELLSTWLATPHVARWWREASDRASVEAAYGPSIDGDDPTELFVVDWVGEPVGLVQRYETGSDPEWASLLRSAQVDERAGGIDYLIGREQLLGVGLGAAVIDRFAALTFGRYLEVASIVVAVQQGNRRSWRALEKAGFERVWEGQLASDDPSDDGPAYLYRRARPGDPLSGSGQPPPA